LSLECAVSLFLWGQYHEHAPDQWWTILLQANILSLGVASLIYLAAGRRLYEPRPRGLARAPLLGIQAILMLTGNAVLLLDPALFTLVRWPGGPFDTPPLDTVTAADGVMGWLTLGVSALAVLGYLRVTHWHEGSHVLASLGVAAGLMLACTAANFDQGDWLAYHTLMMAWTGVAALFLSVAWRQDRRRWWAAFRAEQPPPERISELAVRAWLAILGVPLIGLALRGFLDDPWGAWWSVGAVLAVAVLAGLLAGWQGRPAWAFAAGLCINLAVSLPVVRAHWEEPPEQWWLPLAQVNVLAAGVVALLWLSVEPLARRKERPGWTEVLLLRVQTLLALLGNLALGLPPTLRLIRAPVEPDPLAAETGNWLGWVALLTGLAAALWERARRRGWSSVAALGPLTLSLGALAACTVERYEQTSWLSFHVLTVSWAVTGPLLLGLAWGATRKRPGPTPIDPPRRLLPLLSARMVRAWCVLIGGLVLCLAVRGAQEDPEGPWWSVASVLATATMAALLALWQRSASAAFLACLCLNLAATLPLIDDRLHDSFDAWWVQLLQVNLAATSLGALGWLAVRKRIDRGPDHPHRLPLLPVQALLGIAGNVILLLSPAVLLLLRPAEVSPAVQEVGSRTAWGVFLLALLPALWYLYGVLQRGAAYVLPGIALTAGVLVACTVARWDHRDWLAYQTLTVAWALVGLAVVVGGWRVVRPLVLQSWAGIVGVLVLVLAVRGAVAAPTTPERWALATTVVAGMTAALAWRLRDAVWALAACLCCTLAVTLLVACNPHGPPWHERWVLLVQGDVNVFAAATLLWLGVRRWFLSDAERTRTGDLLLAVQVGCCLVGHLLLLACGLKAVLVLTDAPPGDLTRIGFFGGVLTYPLVALLAWFGVRHLRPTLRAVLLPLWSLHLGATATCLVAWYGGTDLWLSYRVLMATPAATAVLVLAVSRLRWVRTAEEGWSVFQDILATDTWVPVLAVLALGLALPGTMLDPPNPWCGTATLATVSLVAAAMAVRQRREVWALAAALTVNLVVSLPLTRFRLVAGLPFVDWWADLVRLNILASAAAALVWLVAWHRLYTDERPAAPLLLVQVVLGLLGNAVLLLGPAILLIGDPETAIPVIRTFGGVFGWLSFTAALLPALWHLRRTMARSALHVLAGLGLALGVLTACSAAHLDHGNWLAYHVLTLSWALVGGLFLGVAACFQLVALRGQAEIAPSRWVVQAWTVLLGGLVVGLALRSGLDLRDGVWWSVGALVATAGLWTALASWRRQESWIFAAGLCVNLAVSLPLLRFHWFDPFDRWWVLLVQANVVAVSAVALGWLAAVRHLYRVETGNLAATPLLTIQTALGLLGNVALLIGPLAWLIVWPGSPPEGVRQAGGWAGWTALLLAVTAATWHAGRTLARAAVSLVIGLALGVGVLLACSLAPLDGGRHWLGYHVLLASWATVALAVPLVGVRLLRTVPQPDSLPRDKETPAHLTVGVARRAGERLLWQGWTIILVLLLTVLALRGFAVDPTGPWASAATLLTAAVLAGGLAVWTQRHGFVYAGGALLNLAATTLGVSLGYADPLGIVLVNLFGLALGGLAWLGVEALLRWRSPSQQLGSGSLSFVTFSALASLLGLAVVVGVTPLLSLAGQPLPGERLLIAVYLPTLGVLLLFRLWDSEARDSLSGYYVLALAALALAIFALPQGQRWLTVPLLAGLAAAATFCRRVVPGWSWLVDSLGLPEVKERWPVRWFLPCQFALGGLALVLGVELTLHGATTIERFGGPLAVVLLLPTVALLSVGRQRPLLQATTLALLALLPVELSWVGVSPHHPYAGLERLALLTAAVAVLTPLFGVVLPRLPADSGWPRLGRPTVLVAGLLAAFLLATTLGGEAILYLGGSTRLTPAVVLALAAAVVLLGAAAIAFALRPDLDPLRLPERRRTSYVYGAELLLVVLWAHLRLTMPHLFSGLLLRYWPFVVFGVAFLGAAVSEGLSRVGVRVLAEPLRRTGAILPLLPLLAFPARPVGDYSTMWFLAGVFYGLLAVMRRSLALGLLAALLANVGLWFVLHENTLAFVRHPQLWLVPISLTILLAAELNRDRLRPKQLLTTRYVALAVIYLASTAETFLAGLGQDVWRPLVLIGLSIAGVFTGMLLRVRAFLFLGAAFIGFGLFALVRHAAEARAWVWYVAGIALGLAIIVMFAIFEKRRAEVLHLFEKLREWD
jgi:hypothetical protein